MCVINVIKYPNCGHIKSIETLACIFGLSPYGLCQYSFLLPTESRTVADKHCPECWAPFVEQVHEYLDADERELQDDIVHLTNLQELTRKKHKAEVAEVEEKNLLRRVKRRKMRER